MNLLTSKYHIKRNGKGLAVKFKSDGDVEIFVVLDKSFSRDTTVEPIVLDYSEMAELATLSQDGLCPICYDEIPSNDVVCDRCFEDAVKARGLNTVKNYPH